jgi:hypothetical protein
MGGGDPMPLTRYFGLVGSALVLFLIGLGWCSPQSETERVDDAIDRPNIRTASTEQLPERVVIDTSLPTIVPPTTVLEFAERWPVATVADVIPVSKPTIPAPVSDTPRKDQKAAKREPSKRVAVHRAAPKVKIESVSNDKVQGPPAETRLSLMDKLKDGLGQTQAKLMAGLEPLRDYISTARPETP